VFLTHGLKAEVEEHQRVKERTASLF